MNKQIKALKQDLKNLIAAKQIKNNTIGFGIDTTTVIGYMETELLTMDILLSKILEVLTGHVWKIDEHIECGHAYIIDTDEILMTPFGKIGVIHPDDAQELIRMFKEKGNV